MHAFRTMQEDAERQQLLIQAGYQWLRFGIFSLAILSSLTILIWFPPWSLDWNEDQIYVYLGASSLVAILWWGGRITIR